MKKRRENGEGIRVLYQSVRLDGILQVADESCEMHDSLWSKEIALQMAQVVYCSFCYARCLLCLTNCTLSFVSQISLLVGQHTGNKYQCIFMISTSGDCPVEVDCQCCLDVNHTARYGLRYPEPSMYCRSIQYLISGV
jgi:hypothetical protein